MKQILKYYGLTILWALFIFVMCTIKIGDGISHQPLFFIGFDKLVHTGFFFMLVVLWCNGVIRQQNTKQLSYKMAAIITVVAIFYGGLIEILQLTIFTWRSGEWPDFFSDALGACMAIFSVVVINRAINNENV